MKYILIIAIAISLQAQVHWNNYEDALKIAQKSCKPMLIVVYSPTCEPCKKLFNGIDASVELGKMVNQYVPIKISSEKAFYSYGLKVESTPTILILDKDRAEMLKQINGLPSNVNDFMDYLAVGLKAMSTVHGCYKVNR